MKEFFKRVKADFLFSSLLCIILGIVFIVWNEATINALGMIIAIGMIVIGAVYLGSYFLNIVSGGISAAIGVVVLLLGIWILIQPSVIVTMIPIILGVLLISHAVRAIKEALDSRKYGCQTWGISVLLAIISMVLGVICIVNAFGVLKLASVAIGIALIYNGVSDIWIVARTSKAEKEFRKEQEPIDVDFK